MSWRAPAGWYPPDPAQPDRLQFWDGSAWTSHEAKTGQVVSPTPRTVVPRALTSWPVIATGLLLCLVPGLVLLWLRPATSKTVKTAVTATVLMLFGGLGLTSPRTPPVMPSSAAQTQVSPSTAPSIPSTDPTPTASPTPSTTEVVSPEPSPPPSEPTASPQLDKAAPGTAVADVAVLAVKGRAPKTGYARAQFGSGWVDVDRNGCDTRNDMLRVYLTSKVMSGSCKVLAGTLADPYTGHGIRFVYGGPSEVDVDHVVALSDAWQKGAAQWPFAKRVALANDPLNLQPTDSGANRRKGDADAASWLPPSAAYRCTYVARQAAVKKKYQIWVTDAEKAAMITVLAGCPGQAAPAPGPQPTIASNTGGAAPAPSRPKPAPTKPTPTAGGLDPNMGTCKAAKAAGYGPYVRGVDPEYDWYRDRDRDGIVCE